MIILNVGADFRLTNAPVVQVSAVTDEGVAVSLRFTDDDARMITAKEIGINAVYLEAIVRKHIDKLTDPASLREITEAVIAKRAELAALDVALAKAKGANP